MNGFFTQHFNKRSTADQTIGQLKACVLVSFYDYSVDLMQDCISSLFQINVVIRYVGDAQKKSLSRGSGVPGSVLSLGLCGVCMCVLLVIVQVSSGFSAFLQQPKNTPVGRLVLPHCPGVNVHD